MRTRRFVEHLPPGPHFWMLYPDAWTEHRLDRFWWRGAPVEFNHGETWKTGAYHESLRQGGQRSFGARSARIRDDYTPLQLNLPDGDWPAPDHFTFGLFNFVSARLRDALALPPDDVQYLAIELAAGGARAIAQDYRLFRPLRHQAAMDGPRSLFGAYGEQVNGPPPIGERWFLRTLAIRTDLVPCADLFWVDEAPATLLATDALALRVIKAHCTGIRFRDPLTLSYSDGFIRERSARGVRVTKYW